MPPSHKQRRQYPRWDGDRLPPERQLIEQFGYSRAIVREALRSCLEPSTEPASDAPHNTRRFHRTLSEAAHNNVLAVIVNLVMELRVRRTNTGEFEPTHLVQVHSAIIDAIEARDIETATQRTLEHLVQSKNRGFNRGCVPGGSNA